MQMYEIITRMTELSGMTFDEIFVLMTFVLLAFYGGLFFMTSFAFDLGRYLYRIVKELFFLLLYKLRLKGRKEL